MTALIGPDRSADALVEETFPGVDMLRFRVSLHLAQAMASLELARASSSPRPELRALLDRELDDAHAFVLEAFKLTIAQDIPAAMARAIAELDDGHPWWEAFA